MDKYILDYQPCHDGMVKLVEIHAFGLLTWYVEIDWYSPTLGAYSGAVTQEQMPLNWAYA